MIQAGGKKVLVDALFNDEFFLAPSPELLAQMTGGSGPFADVDLLLVTHLHGDHFNPKMVAEFLRHHAHCQFVAHTQVIDLLRKEEGFAQIEKQIHEIRQEPGSRESMTMNGIALDVLVLATRRPTGMGATSTRGFGILPLSSTSVALVSSIWATPLWRIVLRI
jgi:glyoxylase-like metal-dependent hydrolase (beta-lactamase superfamily II)